MNAPRFFLADLRQLVLTGGQAHHCRRVLRLKAGDVVSVFDGCGNQAECRITGFTRDSVCLEAIWRFSTQRPPCHITLAQAVPKKNMDWIIEKATELGAAEIVPLISERAVARPDAGKLRRWREIALESCKQCGNNWLPVIHPPQSLAGFLRSVDGYDLKLVASLQPDAKRLGSIPPAASVLLLIGPEGDFTPAEYELAKSAGCRPLSLGPLVLRAETAAVCALSIIRYELAAG
jgi:16S rRNA (uracil1498-N3)-methyltransferase